MANDLPGTSNSMPQTDGTQISETQKRRESELRKHSFFQLRVMLISGKGLVAMDKSGTSDPYVKFKVGGRMLYKSKTVHKDLNPKWDETFIVPIEDPFQPINIKVNFCFIQILNQYEIMSNFFSSHFFHRCLITTGDYKMILWVRQNFHFFR